MGDRAMAEIKTSEGSLFVYTHWGGEGLPQCATEAVIAAKPRWDDEPYAVKIIVDQLIKEGRDQETGFGIMLTPEAEDEYNGDKPSVIIDLPLKELAIIRPKNNNPVQTISFNDL